MFSLHLHLARIGLKLALKRFIRGTFCFPTPTCRKRNNFYRIHKRKKNGSIIANKDGHLVWIGEIYPLLRPNVILPTLTSIAVKYGSSVIIVM